MLARHWLNIHGCNYCNYTIIHSSEGGFCYGYLIDFSSLYNHFWILNNLSFINQIESWKRYIQEIKNTDIQHINKSCKYPTIRISSLHSCITRIKTMFRDAWCPSYANQEFFSIQHLKNKKSLKHSWSHEAWTFAPNHTHNKNGHSTDATVWEFEHFIAPKNAPNCNKIRIYIYKKACRESWL